MKRTAPERNEIICRLYREGMSLSAIGLVVGISHQRVGQILREMKVERRVPSGHTNDPEYDTWCAIKTRCYNPNSPTYPRYGGKGIILYSEWRDSYSAFYESVGPRPSPTHTIDRIDTNGHYEPGNVRWASKREQSLNRNYTWAIVAFGECKCLKDWSLDERCKIGITGLRDRLNKGMDAEEAITKPSKLGRYKSATHKECSECGNIKKRSEFNVNRPGAAEPHKGQCKICQTRLTRERHKANRVRAAH